MTDQHQYEAFLKSLGLDPKNNNPEANIEQLKGLADLLKEFAQFQAKDQASAQVRFETLLSDFKKQGVNLNDSIQKELPAELSKILYDPAFSKEVGAHMEQFSQQMKEKPEGLQTHIQYLLKDLQKKSDDQNVPVKVDKKKIKQEVKKSIRSALNDIDFTKPFSEDE